MTASYCCNLSWTKRWTALLLLAMAALHPQSIFVQSFTTPSLLQCDYSSYSSSSTRLCSTTSSSHHNVRFLGQGPNAIIRPGVVLVAPTEEFHHFYRQAAIFIYAMGEDDDYEDGNTYMIRGAIIDHPTPFTLGEMADSSLLESIKDNPMAGNLIYRGGDKGGDSVFMLHNQETIGDGDMIGTSGIFQGGLQEALEACQRGTAQPEDFKFFFNFCQFTEHELESMLEDDPWIAVEIPSEYVLNAEWDRGDCWKQLRNALQREIDSEDTAAESQDPRD